MFLDFDDILNCVPMIDYKENGDIIEVTYKIGMGYSVLEFPSEDLEEIKNTFRKQVINDVNKLDRVKFILLLNSFTYLMTTTFFLSLFVTLFDINSVNLFMSSYILGMGAQLICHFLGETFPMFHPKTVIEKKKVLEKYKLFLENEKEILDFLKKEEESNNRVTSFSGDIRDVRNTSYEDIIHLIKQAKKHSM